MRRAESIAKESGANIAFFDGLMKDGKGSYRGFFDSTTNTLYVSANNKNYTAEQIARHEITHKKIANGELNVDEVKKRIAENYDVDEIAAKYAEAYKGSGMTVEEAFEEIICDAEAGMNVFEEAGKSEEEIRQYGEVLAETKQTAEESEPRAPPTGMSEKYSKNIEKRPSEHLAWAIENGIINKDDQGAFWDAIDRIRDGEKITRSSDGKYMAVNGNTIMITDGNFDSPTLEMVIIAISDNPQENAGIKGVFYGKRDEKWSVQESLRIAEDAFGSESIGVFRDTDYIEDEREASRREGRNSETGNYRTQEKVQSGIKASREITPEEDARFSQEIDTQKRKTALESARARANAAERQLAFVKKQNETIAIIDKINEQKSGLFENASETPEFKVGEKRKRLFLAAEETTYLKFYVLQVL